MKEGLKMLEKIEYTKQGDYLIPNLTMKKEKIPAGKYSMMRYNYLLNHKNHELTILVMNNELNSHLQEIQDQASKRVEMLVEEMAKKENITEELKAQDQMKWVGLMNNIKMTAEEIVATELIYQ
ncbi:MAG: TnpV protein [Clostridiales bacterium]|nr:TnpV protein [Clostridiales bacterium]